ncbi:Ankyrin repeat domain-containing protein 17 [Lasiodiplodia theobromae]|uniref:Ankyrin repeat domain-containing protein 17 n=1 Tax=Lasiodiplodia theobromae TaxID=45133 RepID=UPI0015C2F5BA|nr:Ankyrin repeat domain-containing protein 17 [Lasiodiplodia theobromae]KAF4545261.1 Ankyrin repeat domain-containing protein 17 [Lasiodiplodia theobromae]
METTTVDDSESRTDTPKFLWQRALGQADDDLRKTLLATKTNRRDVLKAVRKVVQEKRCQSLWKRWTYDTAEKDIIIVRDLLEKILCWLDLIQSNAGLDPQGFSEDLQAAWRLIWSPFRFLLRKTAEDAQAFGEMVNDLAFAFHLLVRYLILEAERPSQAIEDTSNSDGAILSVYHAVYDILAHYIRLDNKGTGAEVDTHQLREKLFQADSNAKAAIGHTNSPMESLYLRSAAPETVHEVRIPDELGSSLRQWGVPALLEADEDQSTPGTRCELLESESFRSWWESSTSSILSLCGAAAYIDCSKLSSALEILQHVVASFTLVNDEKCCDVLITEWKIKQAVSQQDGSTVGPLNLQDCLRITLDIAAANPMTILLDGVLDTDDEKLSDSLIEVVDKSENVVKVLLVTEHDIPLLGCERSGPAAANFFHTRNAKAQPSWKDLEATTPPSVHLSETEQQATLHDAIKSDDIASVVSLIHHTPRVAAQTDPKDALSTAVLHNHTDILTYLLNALPSTSSNDALAFALLIAALTNHTRCARTLLSHHGINRTATDTALRAAATRGHALMIKQLLAYYYAENAAAAIAAAATVLPLAAQHGHTGAVRALLDVAAAARNTNGTISAAVQLAAAGGHADVVELLLLDRGGGVRPALLKSFMNIDGAALSSMMAPLPPPLRMAHESKWDSLLRCTSPGWLERRAGMRGRRCVVNEGSEDEDDEEKKKGAAAAATTQTERTLAAMLGGDDLSSVEKQLARGDGGGDVAAVVAAVAGPLLYTQRWSRTTTRGRQLPPGRGNWWPLQRRQLHALEVAAAAGREAVVGLFLRRREELDIRAEHVGRAFAAAAANGHVRILQQLLPLLEGAETAAAAAAASDALEGAVRNGHAETVEFLLEYGAAHGRAEQDVRIVLENISSEDSATFVLKLLQLAQERDSEAKLNELRQKALCVAAEHGNVLVLDSILSSGVALENGSFAKAMYAACRPGHTAAALALINSEARKLLESDDIEDCPLVAAREGHAELAQCLLPHLNLEKVTEVLTRCIEVAAGNNHLACTQVLMAALTGEDCIRAARCAFATAAQNGHADMARLLLERGADPERESMTHAMKECINRFTLHSPRFPCSRVPSGDGWKKGSEVGTRATVRTLLEHGADANAESVLHTAAQNCPVEVVEWLIEHGADVKAAATGPNSVFVAVAGRELDSLAVMELLLRAGGQLEPSGESIHPVLAKALEFFDGNIEPYRYRGTLKDPDGRFELAESIRYVLEQGPGAMIRRTLQLLPAEKAADARYGLLLQMAAADNDTSLAELLLARGVVDVNAAGFYYGTALQAAARHDHAVMVSLLLAAGADVNVLQGRYHTPLRAAVAGGHTDIVRTLLSHGADVALSFAEDTDNLRTFALPAASTLRLAVERGHFAAAKLLLDAAATDDNNATTADQQRKSPHEQPQPLLIVAAARNDVRMVELLVAAGASDVNLRGKQTRDGGSLPDNEVSALHAACAQGHVDMVRALLRLGADVDAVVQCEKRPPQGCRVVGQPAVVQRWETKSPLATAVWWCNARKKGAAAASVVRELVGAGADVNKPSGRPGRTPLCEAAAAGDVDVVEVLVEAGAALYVGGARDNPLGKACAYGRLDVVEYLMEKICGTDIERAACADGMRRAVEMKQHKAIELLLEFMPADQETLLSVVMAGLPSLVRMVLEAGVHVDARDKSGRTALLAAAVRMKTRLGSSPVTEAFRRAVWDEPFSRDLSSFEEVIRLLVESGADVEDEGPREEANGRKKKCGSLEAPLLVAVEKDHSVIVQLLLEKGADCRQVSEKQDTPLHLACRKGSNHCIRLLLRHGADPNARGADHATPLTLAIKAVRFKPPNPSRKDTFLDVFLKEAPGVRVTEADLLAAAETLYYRANLRLLLDHFVKDIPVSEAVIVTVLKRNVRGNLSEEDRSLLRDLLDHANGIGITAAMVQSTHDADTLDFLLTQCGQHRPVCAITPAVLEGCTDTATIYYLLQHDERLVPTQRAVCNLFSGIYSPAAAGTVAEQQQRRLLPPPLRPEISRVRLLRLLWERNPRLSVSQSMLRGGARNADELAFLLAKARENNDLLLQELVIDQDAIFEIVTWKGCCHADRFRVLLEFCPDLRLENATMARLLKNLVVTEEVFPWMRLTEEWVELMRECGKDIVFTDKMRKRVETLLPSRSRAALKELVFSLERKERDGDEAVQRH